MYVWISNDFDKQLDQIWNQQISQLCIFILPANPKYHLKIKTTPGVYSLGGLVLGGWASDVWMCLNMWCTPHMAIPKQKTGRTRWFRGTLFSDQSIQEWKGRSYLGGICHGIFLNFPTDPYIQNISWSCFSIFKPRLTSHSKFGSRKTACPSIWCWATCK